MNNGLGGFGTLIVRAVSGDGTIPIDGALVYIRSYSDSPEDESNVIFSLRTGIDGMTEPVSLPTTPRENSISPGADGKEYTSYNVEVRKEGYYTVENIGLPIFDGITSIQTAEMIPYSDSQPFSSLRPDTRFFENNGYPQLSQDDVRREGRGNI